MFFTMRTLNAKLLCTCLLPVLSASDTFDCKGLAPFQLSQFRKNVVDSNFKCLSGVGVVPTSAVNDDYCDCPDGSDEPGTSACAGVMPHSSEINRDFYLSESELEAYLQKYPPKSDSQRDEFLKSFVPTSISLTPHKVPMVYRDGTINPVPEKLGGSNSMNSSNVDLPWGFFCHQKQSLPKFIAKWKLFDGVCDCCDGADEFPGGCQNTCAREGEKFREATAGPKLEADRVLEEKQKILAEGPQMIRQWKKEVITLADEIRKLQETLKVNKTAVESTPEKPETDVKKTDVDLKPAKEQLLAAQTNESLSQFAKWAEDDGQLDSEGSLGDDLPDDDYIDYEDDNLHKFEVDSDLPESQGTEPKPGSYVSLLWDKILSLFSKSSSSSTNAVSGGTPSGPAVDLQQKMDRLLDLESALKVERHLTRYPTLAYLADQTFTYRHSGFTYEVKPFRAATQKHYNGTTTLLGTYHKVLSFSLKAALKSSSVNGLPSLHREILSETMMLFDGGDICESNKQQRTFMLHFVCAEKTSLLKIEEPFPCQYVGLLATPVVCEEWIPQPLKPVQQHSEL